MNSSLSSDKNVTQDAANPSLLHHCGACRWRGPAPMPLVGSERLAVLEALPPGARVPSGRCPSCGGLTAPATLLIEELFPATPGGDGIPDPDPSAAPWDVRVERAGEALAIYLVHPEGPGFELIVEVHGDKPTLAILPWSDALGIDEAEPLASVKIGHDHVALRNARQDSASAVVCAPDSIHPSLPLSRQQWSRLGCWLLERMLQRDDLLPRPQAHPRTTGTSV